PVAHVGPLVLVEPGRPFQRLLVDMEDERILRGSIGQGGEGDGEELVADAEESAEGQDGIGDAPLQMVDHQVFDFPQAFPGGVLHAAAEDLAHADDARPRPYDRRFAHRSLLVTGDPTAPMPKVGGPPACLYTSVRIS